MATSRLFDFPYNGENLDVYFKRLEPFKDKIDALYCALPGVKHHLTGSMGHEDYDEKCAAFLKASKGLYSRSVTLNSIFDVMDDEKFALTMDKIFRDIDEYEPETVICANLYMAMEIRRRYPNIQIDTSCNTYQFNLSEVRVWNELLHLHFVNPPRQAGRMPGFLKDLHDHGFKLKVLCNESCFFGCPQMAAHCLSIAVKHNRRVDIDKGCYLGSTENFFKGCYLLPRWLEKLDPYVDVWKIQGRYMQTDYIFKTLEHYVKGEDCPLSEIFDEFHQCPTKDGKDISTELIPDKLLTCEMKDCHRTCFLCEENAKKLFRSRTFSLDPRQMSSNVYMNIGGKESVEEVII